MFEFCHEHLKGIAFTYIKDEEIIQHHNNKLLDRFENSVEQETGRRPSRRAALVAAKKIFNTVRNFGISDNPADRPINPLPSPKPVNTPHPYTRPKPKKNPPINVDLQMECCDDFLSPIQAEFLLKAQIQYNMVMKNLRELMACNVKVIQTDANGVPTVVTSAPSVNLRSGNVTVNSKSSGIKRVNTGSAVVVPMTLIQSPIIIT
ncbi:hypothetical protein AVEN_72652-1 [Araneus ventricosus]|uniref:Uncharacterized protein n=1 Tax=Araneus ventricosus TaxID=182803 RepID=A0A4Y2SDM7_ARAVE|nr:hypothetical protein AVEN_72652-1 [Araneus ventricosus]